MAVASSPRFTVVTPTFNRGELLERAIRSVLAQTYPAWEMIVVDDASTDDTPERVEAFRSDPRILYHHEDENHGCLYARNRAWDRISAETDWIVHLDSDDELLPDALDTIRAGLRERPGFEWYNFGARYDHGAMSSRGVPDGFVGSYEGGLLGREGKGEWVQVLHRNIVDEGYRFRETFREHESTALWYRLARSRRICFCTEVVRIQNSRTVSLTRSGQKDAAFYRSRIERKRTFFREFGADLRRFDPAAYEQQWAHFVKTLARAGNHAEARRLWREGVGRRPLCPAHWRTLFALLGAAVRRR